MQQGICQDASGFGRLLRRNKRISGDSTPKGTAFTQGQGLECWPAVSMARVQACLPCIPGIPIVAHTHGYVHIHWTFNMHVQEPMLW